MDRWTKAFGPRSTGTRRLHYESPRELRRLQEVERAQSDGRWDAAYDSASKATTPSDFQSALDSNTRAKDFFETLDSRNRYAVLFRIQTAKKVETRGKKIAQFVQMLEQHEKVHQ